MGLQNLHKLNNEEYCMWKEHAESLTRRKLEMAGFDRGEVFRWTDLKDKSEMPKNGRRAGENCAHRPQGILSFSDLIPSSQAKGEALGPRGTLCNTTSGTRGHRSSAKQSVTVGEVPCLVMCRRKKTEYFLEKIQLQLLQSCSRLGWRRKEMNKKSGYPWIEGLSLCGFF